MTVFPRQTDARAVAAPRCRPTALGLIPAALTIALVGCSTSGMRDCFVETTTCVRVSLAAEKAFLHRGDLFHECCSCPLDFKHGFKNGYRDVALYGEDCCAPPTPPSCFWGCSTSDPCERVERLNCYYDGWAHGAIAAGQDGVAGLNVVPIRNICGGYEVPGPIGPFGPSPFGDPAAFNPYGPNGAPAAVPTPAPTPLPLTPEVIDQPLRDVPTPAPIPLGPSFDGLGGTREGSVGSSNTDALLERLLEADSIDDGIDAPTTEASPIEPAFPQVQPGDAEDPARSDDSTPQLESDFRTVPSSSDDGPRVTTLWDSGS